MATEPKIRSLKTFKVLQAGRGVAALLVVVAHVGEWVTVQPHLWQMRLNWPFAFLGKCGVDFFFILSGIVILMAHSRDLGQTAKVPSFLWKRFRRIYPIYWALLIPTLALQISEPSSGIHRFWIVVSSIALIHVNSIRTIMIPAWTLFHEVLFYLLFTTLLFRRDVGVLVLAAWMGASFWFLKPSAMTVHPDSYLSFFLSPVHLLFGFGLIVGCAIRKNYTTNSVWPLLGGLTLFLANVVLIFATHQHEPVRLRIVGDVGLAVFVWAAMGVELYNDLKVPAFMLFLGDASYSLYLAHYIALSIVGKALYSLDHRLHTPMAIVIPLLFAVSVLSGVATHIWIEAPLLKLFSGKRTARAIEAAVS
jgi:peptidoglycan/LPS O-acetylase OafA/YrhL